MDVRTAEGLDDEAAARFLTDDAFAARVHAAAEALDLAYVPGQVPSGAVAMLLHAGERMLGSGARALAG